MTENTRTVKLHNDTLAALDEVGKEITEEHGIKSPSYDQIVGHLLKKAKRKK